MYLKSCASIRFPASAPLPENISLPECGRKPAVLKFVLLLIKTPYALLRHCHRTTKGAAADREVADTTMAWRQMSGEAERAAFIRHTSADYVLGGAEASASSDSWAGN